jgi:hypothetical protein
MNEFFEPPDSPWEPPVPSTKSDEQFQKEMNLIKGFLANEQSFHLVDERLKQLISEGWTQKDLVLLVNQVWEQDDSPADDYTVVLLDQLTGFCTGERFFD